MLFEDLAVRAETDDMDGLARDAAQAMNQCLSCHAAFRVHSGPSPGPCAAAPD
jgi:hypothetical protein